MSRQGSETYSVKRGCEWLGCPRSTYYYEQLIDPPDAVDGEASERVRMRWPFYGYRRMTAQRKRAYVAC